MTKKRNVAELEITRLAKGEQSPPPLSEKRIAQLQAAVEASRKRTPLTRGAAPADDGAPHEGKRAEQPLTRRIPAGPR